MRPSTISITSTSKQEKLSGVIPWTIYSDKKWFWQDKVSQYLNNTYNAAKRDSEYNTNNTNNTYNAYNAAKRDSEPKYILKHFR